ncbi:MAG: hypothetical protein M5U34_24920 [Chloroflexi bacterium]|nr:hypothetical protein [Chloroflexota bacterium]
MSPDTFNLSLAGNTWSVVMAPTSVTLAAGMSAAVVVTVDIPAGAP